RRHKQGRENLNRLREEIGLEPMPDVWHNLDFDERNLIPFLKEYYKIEKDIRFGFYDVLTRVNYPSCVKPDEPKYATNYQAVAEKLYYAVDGTAFDKYSREACFLLIKK
ncbi:unnamed protein product, partial [marine sediment metagenome]